MYILEAYNTCAKEKMSQIRNAADQKSIINALYGQGNESAKEVADIMYKNIEA